MKSGSTLRSGLATAEVLSVPEAVLNGNLKHSDRLYIGLTGGIGSGKSSFAIGMENAGAVVISADDVAREVVLPGSVGLTEVKEAFGTRILSSDGSLDRAALGELVFGDPEARVRLERIIHPRIGHETMSRVVAAPANSVIVYDVPLLVENQMEKQFDIVIVVSAPLEKRLVRLEHRGISRSEALGRIKVQANDTERRAIANIWVENGGTQANLQELVSVMVSEWFSLTPHEA